MEASNQGSSAETNCPSPDRREARVTRKGTHEDAAGKAGLHSQRGPYVKTGTPHQTSKGAPRGD